MQRGRSNNPFVNDGDENIVSHQQNISNYSYNNNRHDDPEAEFNRVDEMLGHAKSVRQETLDLTRQGLSRLHETELSASNTMSRLAIQSETLHKSKRDLDAARQHQLLAEDQVQELKRLNKWFSFRNPFRRAARSKQIHKDIERNYTEKIQREVDTRRGESASKQRFAMPASSGSSSSIGSRKRYQSSSKYQSELLDEQDLAQEREIDENIDQIGSAVGRLKMMASAMNEEIQSQNHLIGGLGSEADDMNVRIGITRHSIKKFGG